MDSPALSFSSDLSDFTDEELDRYFASYVPLSNLPTPPPARDMTPVNAPHCPSQDGNNGEVRQLQQSPELEVYATQLSNLVPTNASPQRASAPVIRGLLLRAQLPAEIVAFTACILDALSQRFASSWRSCLSPGLANSYFAPRNAVAQVPAAGPELIVLAAMSLAYDFINDRGRSNAHWTQIEGDSLFGARELELTKTCILKDMDYGLFRITDVMVQRMMRDNLSPRPASVSVSVPRRAVMGDGKAAGEGGQTKTSSTVGLQGVAVWVHGVLTPGPSP